MKPSQEKTLMLSINSLMLRTDRCHLGETAASTTSAAPASEPEWWPQRAWPLERPPLRRINGLFLLGQLLRGHYCEQAFPAV
jgi:hypothetical protein